MPFPHDGPCASAPSPPFVKAWSVTVERDGESIVTLSSNMLAGRDLSAEDEAAIRTAGQHLLAFIGEPAAAAAAGAAARPAQWQPIATAPKVPDDVIALGAYDKYGSWLVAASSWCDDPSDGEPCWLAWDYNMPPTHWTRLPAAPAADGGAVARPQENKGTTKTD